MDELQAIRRLKQGDIGGLECLVARYQVRAARAAFLITHNGPLTEEIVQEAFVRLYHHIRQFDETRPFEPYFIQSVVNAALNAVEKESRQIPFSAVNAVNELRLANGLPPLNVHPVLMQIAQTEVDGIAAGMYGHWRPNNMTLAQWLLSLGYPLSEDLSQDGYRSENLDMGPGFTVQDAISHWNSDDPHLNTMLSPNRSDIGAGVAASIDEWGQTVYYYAIETALQTRCGKMQYDAYPILTAIVMDQVAVYGDATQAAQSLLVPQYIVPVIRATSQPDGDVIHEVNNGQSMWSIAIEYGVKIEQVRQLNNLSSTDIRPGQKLLIQKGATQPVPTPNETETPAVPMILTPWPPVEAHTSTPKPTEVPSVQYKKENALSLGAIAVAALFLGTIFTAITRKKD